MSATTTITLEAPEAEKIPTPSTVPIYRQPLKLGGVLDQFKSFDVTPVIGREFPEANLKEWLEAPDSDELLRDLAITISRRGVVFFRKQDDLDNNLQKKLAQRLGELSGKPSTSKLHIHPKANSVRERIDDEITVLSSDGYKRLDSNRHADGQLKQRSSFKEWHIDLTFEKVPSDYTILRLTELPATGGDTLWASGYELYDRISPPYQKFLESLTVTHAQPGFNESAKRDGFPLYQGERGAPENIGEEFFAVHPLIRTNPVTNWKSVYVMGNHTKKVNDVSEAESRHLLDWFVQLVVENHDIQVRHRWQNPNDVAIWDNRSVYHTATWDYDGSRAGQRAVSIGERPYLNSRSTGRREALEAEGVKA